MPKVATMATKHLRVLLVLIA